MYKVIGGVLVSLCVWRCDWWRAGVVMCLEVRCMFS